MSSRDKSAANPVGFASILTKGRQKAVRQNRGSDCSCYPRSIRTPIELAHSEEALASIFWERRAISMDLTVLALYIILLTVIVIYAKK